MPQYLMMVKGDENFTNVGPPPAALNDAIMKLAERDTKNGTLVSTGGLHHTSKGFKARCESRKITVTDGPFAEAKEVLGGFAIYRLKDKQEAVRYAREFLELHQAHWPAWSCEVEVREMWAAEYEPELA